MGTSRKPIYLDYHATTPVDARVLESMLPYFTEVFGNAASKSHIYGNEAFAAVESSREVLARSVCAKPQEIVLTSGATESVNLAIKGTALARGNRGGHFITVATEHKAVLDCFTWLSHNAFDITILPVDSMGLVEPDDVAQAIRPDTVLVCVMAANNEIGVLQPLREIGRICREKNVYFMTDATQALGKLPLDVQDLHVDLLAASGHKLYGPKGIGLLYVRRSNPRVSIHPIMHGGGHERGLRSGTLATPSIVGFATAVSISKKEMSSEQQRIRALRDHLFERLQSRLPEMRVHGCIENRLAGNLNIYLPGIQSEALLIAVKNDLALSTGSACTSAAVLPSHVLIALGVTPDVAHASIRLCIGRYTTQDDVEFAAMRLSEEATRLRRIRGEH